MIPSHPSLARRESALVVLVDVQERLFAHLADAERMAGRAEIVLKAAQRLAIPILRTEQNPRALGATIPELAAAAGGVPILKTTFSAMGAEAFAEALFASQKDQVVIMGAEAHLCVVQTALDVVASGYRVFVPEDAVSSRAQKDTTAALARLVQAGVQVLPTESLLFEWLRDYRHEAFREIQGWIK